MAAAAAAAAAATSTSLSRVSQPHPCVSNISLVVRILKFAARDVDEAISLSELCESWHEASLEFSESLWRRLIEPSLKVKSWLVNEEAKAAERHRQLVSTLFAAVRADQYPVIEYLVTSYGVSPSTEVLLDGTGVFNSFGVSRALKLPVSALGNNNNNNNRKLWTPLHHACFFLRAKSIKSLLLAGAQCSPSQTKYEPRHESSYGDHRYHRDENASALQVLLSRGGGDATRKEQAIQSFVSTLQLVSLAKDDVSDEAGHEAQRVLHSLDAYGQSVVTLLVLSPGPTTKMLEILLRAGCDPDLRPSDKYPTPLIDAVVKQQTQLVKMLLAKSESKRPLVDVNAVVLPSRKTALHFAAEGNNANIVEMLLSCRRPRADVLAKDANGKMPIHCLKSSRSHHRNRQDHATCEKIKTMLKAAEKDRELDELLGEEDEEEEEEQEDN